MGNTLSGVTDYLWTQSWQIAVLAVVIAAVSLLLKNKSAHVRYLLWMIVLAKCLIPPLVTIPLAILPAGGEPRPVLITSVRMPVVTVDAVDTGESKPAIVLPSVPVAEPTIMEKLAEVTVHQWVVFVWITGAGLFALIAITKAFRVNRWLSRERKLLSVELRTEIEQLLAGLGIESFPRVWLVDGIGQPFVWGLVRGSIYLPADFAGINNAGHRRGVLGHELSHILRFDAAVNLLQIIAQGLFWFHPFVWWANRKIRAEREKCCDEMAIARFGTAAKDYSRAIVDTLLVERKSAIPVPSLAVAGPVKNIEERIKTIMKPGKRFYKYPSLMAAIVVLVLAGISVPTTIALTARQEDKADMQVEANKEAKVKQRIESAKKLSDLGKALLLYANDHEEKYPDTLEELKPYIRKEQDFQWILENVNYVGLGKSADAPPDAILAYDKALLEKGKGTTNMLFNDGRVRFVTVERGVRLSEETEIKQWLESGKKLSVLGKALSFYANDHEVKYPDTLEGLRPYMQKEQDFQWILENVRYIGKGKSADMLPNVILAYDKVLFEKGEGTNVLFNDTYVGFGRPERLEYVFKLSERIESVMKLYDLGKALLLYANDHYANDPEAKYPDTLEELKPYIRKEQDFQWILENVEYPGRGKSLVVSPYVVIAYDKTLLEKGEGTNVLFNDGGVAFKEPEQFEKLGVKLSEEVKAEIHIEARFLFVSVDSNEIKDFFEEEKLVFPLGAEEPNYTSVLNAEQADRLLELTRASAGSKVLAAPNILVLDGESATLRTQRTIRYEYIDPNATSTQPEQRELPIGTIIQVAPTVQVDGEGILLELDFEHSNLLGFESGLPQMEITHIQSRVVVADGQMMLLGGQKITDEDEQGVIKMLLLLVKAGKVEQKSETQF